MALIPMAATSSGAAPTPSIDGIWSGHSDGMGTAMTLDLRSRAGVVSGTVARGHSPVAPVSGSWKPPRLLLTLHLDATTTPVLDLKQLDDEKLSGTLTWAGPSVQKMTFVRP